MSTATSSAADTLLALATALPATASEAKEPKTPKTEPTQPAPRPSRWSFHFDRWLPLVSTEPEFVLA